MKRRNFIKNTCAAMGYTTLYSTLFNLKSIGAATLVNNFNTCSDYKALVCFTMNGGNDSFNMLVPYKNPGQSGTLYDDYVTIRTDLALGLNDITEIIPNTPQPTKVAMHNALDGMRSIFNDGDLAFVSNVGSLVETITHKNQIWNNTKEYPLGLYSHSDQQMHWQTARPLERTGYGWGGKVAEMIDTVNCNDTVSVNISLNGNNVFQAGQSSFSYTIDPFNGSIGIRNYGNGGTFNNLRDAAMDNLLDHNYQDAFKNAYVNEIKNANDTHLLFSGAIENISVTNTFGESRLQKSMEMIARTIKAANTPGNNLSNMKRQIFYVDLGGFDVHDEVINSQQELFENINSAMVSFYNEMVDSGLNNNVTTFAVSEFGRTLTSNGQGSDHGWGGNVFIMGGAVNGKEVYGTYPELELNNDMELGGGVYVPTTSADEYFAELALWFGVSKTELPLIFPNITNFYSLSDPNSPLGLLS